VETYDISHAVATQLKAHWRDDAHWQGFLKQAGATLSRFQQTDLAFLLPPRQRSKARYMAIDAHIEWAQRLIGYHDQGDFSAIGRPCVFTGNAYARLRRLWGKPRVEPVARPDRTQYDSRAALCEALRAAGATALDDLDDAFWRLADRGYARFLQAFAWVLPYRNSLPEWAQTIAVSKTIQTVLKTKGCRAPHRRRCRRNWPRWDRSHPRSPTSARGPADRRAGSGQAARRCCPGWHPPTSSNRSSVITKPSPPVVRSRRSAGWCC
jgi:hypothetical protein